MELDEWARVLPVAKPDSIAVRSASEIEYDAKNEKALEAGSERHPEYVLAQSETNQRL